MVCRAITEVCPADSARTLNRPRVRADAPSVLRFPKTALVADLASGLGP